MDDPSNCGSCGNSCPAPASGFASCTAGQCGTACQPGWALSGTTCVSPGLGPSTTLATGGVAIQAMLLDTNNVYWTDSSAGTVSSVAKSGGAIVVLAQGQNKPMGLAVDDAYAYWSNNLGGAIMRAPKDGSGSPSLVAAATSPTDIAVVGANLYFLQNNAIEVTAKIGGGTTTQLGSWGSSNRSLPVPGSLAANGTYLAAVANVIGYFTFDVIDPESGSILAQRDIAAARIDVGGIDSTEFYFGTGYDCPGIGWNSLPSSGGTNGGRALPYQNNQCPGPSYDVQLIAADSCAVFWESAGAGVSLISKAPGSTYPIGISAGWANAIAADESAVYVATATTITRVALQ
jgi:hypothetical protein